MMVQTLVPSQHLESTGRSLEFKASLVLWIPGQPRLQRETLSQEGGCSFLTTPLILIEWFIFVWGLSVGVHTIAHMWESRGSWLFPSTLWVPETELMSSGWAARAEAISLVLEIFFLLIHMNPACFATSLFACLSCDHIFYSSGLLVTLHWLYIGTIYLNLARLLECCHLVISHPPVIA